MRRIESALQQDLLKELDSALYLAMGANKNGVFADHEIAINAEIKRNIYARISLAFDGKYWHIGKDISLPNEGMSYYPSIRDRYKTREIAYRRGLRMLRVSLCRILARNQEHYGEKKAAKMLLEKLKNKA